MKRFILLLLTAFASFAMLQASANPLPTFRTYYDEHGNWIEDGSEGGASSYESELPPTDGSLSIEEWLFRDNYPGQEEMWGPVRQTEHETAEMEFADATPDRRYEILQVNLHNLKICTSADAFYLE